MDNQYYFLRPTYQLWLYSRRSQTANEEGNVLQGDHPVITEHPCAKEWQTPLETASLSNLSVQPKHNGPGASLVTTGEGQGFPPLREPITAWKMAQSLCIVQGLERNVSLEGCSQNQSQSYHLVRQAALQRECGHKTHLSDSGKSIQKYPQWEKEKVAGEEESFSPWAVSAT